MNFPREALNTLHASRWKLLMARLFGQKFVHHEADGANTWRVVCYEWRGHMYMTDFRKVSGTLTRQHHPLCGYANNAGGCDCGFD